jgi:hypothetical protein
VLYIRCALSIEKYGNWPNLLYCWLYPKANRNEPAKCYKLIILCLCLYCLNDNVNWTVILPYPVCMCVYVCTCANVWEQTFAQFTRHIQIWLVLCLRDCAYPNCCSYRHQSAYSHKHIKCVKYCTLYHTRCITHWNWMGYFSIWCIRMIFIYGVNT